MQLAALQHGIIDEISDKYGFRSYAKMVMPDFLPQWLWWGSAR
jgi:hypothetical protein